MSDILPWFIAIQSICVLACCSSMLAICYRMTTAIAVLVKRGEALSEIVARIDGNPAPTNIRD
jgi:hypothetical protein